MPQSHKKILIAEDNRTIADVLQFSLERAGFEVTVAANGFEAVDCLEQSHYDLLITDHQMPQLCGVELCRRLRLDERFRDLPIALCSAKGLELDIHGLADELGLVKVWFKPFSPRDIVQFVRGVLESVAT